MPRPLKEIRPGLSVMLRALGFERMANDIMIEPIPMAPFRGFRYFEEPTP